MSLPPVFRMIGKILATKKDLTLPQIARRLGHEVTFIQRIDSFIYLIFVMALCCVYQRVAAPITIIANPVSGVKPYLSAKLLCIQIAAWLPSPIAMADCSECTATSPAAHT